MSGLAGVLASAATHFASFIPWVPDGLHHPHRLPPPSRNAQIPDQWWLSPRSDVTVNTTEACTPDSIASLIQTFVGPEDPVTLTVEGAVHVTDGSFGEGSVNRAYPEKATNLPEVCAVIVSVTNSTAADDLASRSGYRFGLFLPTATAWNGRFLAIGNGGQNGGINWPEMGQGPHYGFATVSTDTGHSSSDAADGLVWALDRPDRVFDWGYRAVRGSVAIAKQMVKAYYYDDNPENGEGGSSRKMWSYWSGCSTGGRQGLKAVQDDPDSFDGALVGAAAWDTRHLFPWIAKIGRDNLREDGSVILNALDASTMTPLAARVQLLCDAADGVMDGIISAPERCAAINVTDLACPVDIPGSLPGCLSEEQARVVRGVWADYLMSEDEGGLRLASNGYEVGSELQWYIFLGGSAPSDFDTQFERYFLYNDTAWSWRNFSDQVVLDSERVNPGQATADHYDVSEFRDRGGKLLMYHGLADGVVPSRSSALYYNRTLAAMGGRQAVDGFMRHFQVPGMQHCAFTPATVNAPWMFAGAGQASWLQLLDPAATTPDVRAGWGTPGFRGNVEYDALLRLMAWTEKGEAPDSMNAVAYDADWSVYRTRKLCPYPQRAKLTGWDQNRASSWTCVEGNEGG